ncbi:hypothetical protein ACFYUK_36800 [Nonomuraea wenchangensis]
MLPFQLSDERGAPMVHVGQARAGGLQAGNVIDKMLQGNPLRKLLDRAAAYLGLPSGYLPARVVSERKRREQARKAEVPDAASREIMQPTSE